MQCALNYRYLQDVKEWDNFITIVPGFNKNKVSYEESSIFSESKDAPIITCAISIKDKVDSTMLDILNYMQISKIITYIIEKYINIFNIDLNSFIEYLENELEKNEEE